MMPPSTAPLSSCPSTGKWLRQVRLCLILGAAAVTLTACEGMQFPWDQPAPKPAQQASTGTMPSVTRGKPSTGPATAKPKTVKPKTAKKPTDNNAQAAPNQAPNEGTPPDTTAPANAAGQPSDMIGRDEAGIRALVGVPGTTRTEGSTTVWSYRKEGCALDLFLFYDVKTGALRVLSYEIKPDSADSNAIQVCYNKFRNV